MAAKKSGKNDNEDCFKMMKDWMQDITKLIKEGFEKQMEVLQHEIFQLKKGLDEEKKKRMELETENDQIKTEMKYLIGEVSYLHEKVEEAEQDKRNCDIVIDNVRRERVSDPRTHLRTIINETLMTEVVEDKDLLSAVIINKKDDEDKMILIGKLRDPSIKKTILSHKRLFIQKRLYARENLTSYKYGLYREAKAFAYKHNYKFVWSKNGNIFIRKNESSDVVLLKNKNSLYNISRRSTSYDLLT